jgi:hypothetical protein
MITKKALKNYLKEGGATLSNTGAAVNFSRGYQVAGVAAVAVVPVSDFNAVLSAVCELLNTCGACDFAGLWVDDGLVYIEKSEHINSLREAMEKGIKRGERSIYDWMLDRCIVTND